MAVALVRGQRLAAAFAEQNGIANLRAEEVLDDAFWQLTRRTFERHNLTNRSDTYPFMATPKTDAFARPVRPVLFAMSGEADDFGHG